jgi:hypothetical protein
MASHGVAWRCITYKAQHEMASHAVALRTLASNLLLLHWFENLDHALLLVRAIETFEDLRLRVCLVLRVLM